MTLRPLPAEKPAPGCRSTAGASSMMLAVINTDTTKIIMSASLKARIMDEIKAAMRAKDSARLGTLRFLQAAIKQVEIDTREELDDAAIQRIVEKQVKQRRESITAFAQAGRTESAAHEEAELLVLQEFLPQQADAAEIEAAVEAAIKDAQAQGATGPAAMGKIMASLKAALAGRADMSQLSAMVKSKLAG